MGQRKSEEMDLGLIHRHLQEASTHVVQAVKDPDVQVTAVSVHVLDATRTEVKSFMKLPEVVN